MPVLEGAIAQAVVRGAIGSVVGGFLGGLGKDAHGWALPTTSGGIGGALPPVISTPFGPLPSPGISEIPTTNDPTTVGPGIDATGALILAKPLLPAIFDGVLGGGSKGSPQPALPAPGVIGAATVSPKPWTNPQGQPTTLDWPTDWDWETWDKENPGQTGLPETNGDTNVAVDWGGLANIGIDFLQGQVGASQSFSGPTVMGQPQALPAQVTVDTRTGQVKPCRRRRRRRLLTPTDLSDLAALSAIVGKGDALKLAVAKAVRR